MIIKTALLGAGATILLLGGVAAFYKARTESLKEDLAAARQTIAVYEADERGRDAAGEAVIQVSKDLSDLIRNANNEIEKAAENDETLALCWSYVPGVDLTGGLRNHD